MVRRGEGIMRGEGEAGRKEGRGGERLLGELGRSGRIMRGEGEGGKREGRWENIMERRGGEEMKRG